MPASPNTKLRLATLLAPVLIGAAVLGGCAEPDQTAAQEASQATLAYDRGDMELARVHIRRALDARDDVPEYWTMLGRIYATQNDPVASMDAYRNAIVLDRANLEALRSICQLSITLGTARQNEQYADQLLTLNPNDPLPLAVKGQARLESADQAGALQFADRILAASPADTNALILKSRVFQQRRNYAEATQPIEASIAAGGDPASRLAFLVDVYGRAGNRKGYESAVSRLAQARSSDPAALLQYADMLYETGRADEARRVIKRVFEARAGDSRTAARILDLWLEQGTDALALDSIAADSSGAPPEIRASYAEYANQLRRPDIALAALGDIGSGAYAAETLNAKAALAHALLLQGKRAEANAIVGRILEADPSQPRALLVRSRLAAAAGNREAAISDARKVIADDRENSTARLLLAEILSARGDTGLAFGALREGLQARPKDTRLATRLATMLIQRGQKSEAANVMRDLALAAPVSLRVEQVRGRICPQTQIPRCADPVKVG